MADSNIRFVIEIVIKDGKQYLVQSDGTFKEIIPFDFDETVDISSICGGAVTTALDDAYLHSPFKRVLEN